MEKLKFFGFIFFTVMISGCSSLFGDKYRDLKTVSYVDPKLYVGKWYEIASFPQWFQKGCVATTANYSLREDGDIDVLNECRLNSFEGEEKKAKGKAVIVDKETNSKLKVSFFWPFYGKYWIIDLAKNYEYAVVGHPNRKYLWILSRSKNMDQKLYSEITDRVQKMEFDISRLQKTPQPQ